MKVYADARMEGHDPGRHHPESPERLVAVTRLLARDSALAWCAPRPAARRWVEEVHTARHVDAVDAQRGRAGSFDADTVVSAGSVDAAYLAAGAAVQVAEAALAGEHALGLVRPPGHHAEAHTAMGFCLFNSIAVAAAYARTELDCRRVAIVDWDVHHGNGTQHIFEARDDVLVCNLHQYPFYPGTGDPEEVGVGRGEGFTVNVGFPGGCKDGDYATAFSDVVLPIIERFAPDLVLVSAGFDAHRADPLAGMSLSEEGFAEMAGQLASLANRVTGRALGLLLEGGYDLAALARSVRAVVDVLQGAATPGVGTTTTDGGGEAVRRARAVHRARWSL